MALVLAVDAVSIPVIELVVLLMDRYGCCSMLEQMPFRLAMLLAVAKRIAHQNLKRYILKKIFDTVISASVVGQSPVRAIKNKCY